MDSGRRGFLALAGVVVTGLAGCADTDPEAPAADDPGATTTDGQPADGGDGTTTVEPQDTTADETTATTTEPTAAETTTEQTTQPPSIPVLNLISNEGEYEPGDVEREAIDTVERGRRVALAARYEITVHDGQVAASFVMTIDDPEGYTAQYPPDDRSADGLSSGYNEYEYHREFATDEFRAGEYTATLEITDRIAELSTTATTTFTVTD